MIFNLIGIILFLGFLNLLSFDRIKKALWWTAFGVGFIGYGLAFPFIIAWRLHKNGHPRLAFAFALMSVLVYVLLFGTTIYFAQRDALTDSRALHPGS